MSEQDLVSLVSKWPVREQVAALLIVLVSFLILVAGTLGLLAWIFYLLTNAVAVVVRGWPTEKNESSLTAEEKQVIQSMIEELRSRPILVGLPEQKLNRDQLPVPQSRPSNTREGMTLRPVRNRKKTGNG